MKLNSAVDIKVLNKKINAEFDNYLQNSAKINHSYQLADSFPNTYMVLDFLGIGNRSIHAIIQHGIQAKLQMKNPFWGDNLISHRMFNQLIRGR